MLEAGRSFAGVVRAIVAHGNAEAVLEEGSQVVWIVKAAKLGDLPYRVFRMLQHVAHVCKLLVADCRVYGLFIASGETRRVRIALKPSAFAVYGEDGRPFVPSGESTVFVGGGQPGFAKTVSVQVPHDNARKR